MRADRSQSCFLNFTFSGIGRAPFLRLSYQRPVGDHHHSDSHSGGVLTCRFAVAYFYSFRAARRVQLGRGFGHWYCFMETGYPHRNP